MEEGSIVVDDEVSPQGSPRSSPRRGRMSGTRSAPSGRTSRSASPRSTPKKVSPAKKSAGRGSGDFFVNPGTNRVVNRWSTVKGEKVENKIFSALKNDARGDLTLSLRMYPTKEAAEEAAKAQRSSAKSSATKAADKFYVDTSKGKYVKGEGRRGRIVVIHKPKGTFEGPFASRQAATEWAVANKYIGESALSASNPRGAKTGPVFRLPGEKGWNQVTMKDGKENPKLTYFKAAGGKMSDLQQSTWEKVKAATAKSSQAKAESKRKEYTQEQLDDAAAQALEAGAKKETVDRTLAKAQSGERSMAQAHADLMLLVNRPASGQRSAYCVYTAVDGKRSGQPRSMLDSNGNLTKSALAEAQRLTGKKGDMSRSEILKALQKALKDGSLIPGPSGKKCAGRGDKDYIDLAKLSK